MGASEVTITIDHDIIPALFGNKDELIKLVEKSFQVTVVQREEGLRVLGTHHNVKGAECVLLDLIKSLHSGVELNTANVEYSVSRYQNQKESYKDPFYTEHICITPHGKYIRPKTQGQKQYVELIRNKMIVFGVGPAGTGKTYLAMAHAITAFKKGEVNRIILTRPAIEAGEKLGFLPGDLQSKVDPYLRPLYDALYEIMGADSYLANLEKGLIEVAPLAYMRGRTLDNAFIVLDEAQNTTEAQMKMFLTRIGYGSKAVITGDTTQNDLPNHTKSGLETAMQIVRNIPEIGICHLTTKDVVRHPLVQKIVDAYDQYYK